MLGEADAVAWPPQQGGKEAVLGLGYTPPLSPNTQGPPAAPALCTCPPSMAKGFPTVSSLQSESMDTS